MMVKVSNFMIALVLVSLFVSVISLFMNGLADNYSTPYDNSTLDTYNHMSTLTENIEDIQTQTESISVESGVFDIIGGLFSDAYSVLLTTKNSFSVFSSMTNSAFSQANLGTPGQFFKNAIIAIVLILIFIGVIISAVVKRDL